MSPVQTPARCTRKRRLASRRPRGLHRHTTRGALCSGGPKRVECLARNGQRGQRDTLSIRATASPDGLRHRSTGQRQTLWVLPADPLMAPKVYARIHSPSTKSQTTPNQVPSRGAMPFRYLPP